MAKVTVDIDLNCSNCNASLDLRERGNRIEVTPCENCLEDERNEGHKEGRLEAESEQE